MRLDVRIARRYAVGATGGSGWNTTVNETGAGHEQRNENFAHQRGRWNISHMANSGEAMAELDVLFQICRGRAHGFRFPDVRDYEANGGHIAEGFLPVIGTGTGAQTQFRLSKTYAYQLTGTAQAGGASTITLAAAQNDFPDHATDDAYNGLVIRITSGTGSGQTRIVSDYVGSTKVATVASAWTTQPDDTSVYSIEAYPCTRIIEKPVAGTVAVYVDGVLSGSASVNITNGVVTFGAAPASGAIITADFEFDCCVRFDTDQQQAEGLRPGLTNWAAIPLVELKPLPVTLAGA